MASSSGLEKLFSTCLEIFCQHFLGMKKQMKNEETVFKAKNIWQMSYVYGIFTHNIEYAIKGIYFIQV